MQNLYIHEALISLGFIQLNERLLMAAEYADKEAFCANLSLQLCLAGQIQEDALEGQDKADAFAKWQKELISCFEDSVSWLLGQPNCFK